MYLSIRFLSKLNFSIKIVSGTNFFLLYHQNRHIFMPNFCLFKFQADVSWFSLVLLSELGEFLCNFDSAAFFCWGFFFVCCFVLV